MHGIAHVVELCCGEAYEAITYFQEGFDALVKSLFRRFGNNPKAMFGLAKIAEVLGQDDILRLNGIHGIRWQSSLLRAVKAILHDYVALAAFLHRAGKQAARVTYLSDPDTSKLFLSTPLSAFKGKHYYKDWVGASNRSINYRATIIAVSEASLTLTLLLTPTLTLTLTP